MYNDDDLAKSKIININDFIFRQNLEFYPNLRGLTCENNILNLEENGEYITSELLTFDLRTLPGEVWLESPNEFMDTIKLNKECESLKDFIDLMNSHRIDGALPVENYGDEVSHIVNKNMDLYYKMKDESHRLNEPNKILLGQIEDTMANLPDNSKIKNIINANLEERDRTFNTGINNTAELPMVRERMLPAVKTNEVFYKKAGFINAAILLYGMINIGIIVAIAIMK